MGHLDGVSWCWERIYRNDVEYVRADLVPDPLTPRVSDVLEHLSMECGYLNGSPVMSNEDAQALVSRVYRWTHLANTPECRDNHPGWLAEFERVESELREAGRLRKRP